MVEGEWSDIDGIEPMADVWLLDRLDLLSEVTHELRGRLLRSMAKPITVAELAQRFDVPVTRLYHHVNRLERDGLIAVVATRKVGGVTERRYRAVAESFKVDPRLIAEADQRDLAVALGALFDVAKVELQSEVEAGTIQAAVLDEQVILSLAELTLRPERLAELKQRLVELVEEFGVDPADEPGNDPVRLFVAAFPAQPHGRRPPTDR